MNIEYDNIEVFKDIISADKLYLETLFDDPQFTKNIDDRNFDEVYYGTSVRPSAPSLTSVLLMSGIDPLEYLTYIPSQMFQGLTNIQKLVIPKNITSIEDEAMDNCVELESVEILGDVRVIPYRCFSECLSLKTVSLPESVGVIKNYAFFACDSLKEINYAGTMRQWSNVLKETGWNTLSTVKMVICSDGVINLMMRQI